MVSGEIMQRHGARLPLLLSLHILSADCPAPSSKLHYPVDFAALDPLRFDGHGLGLGHDTAFRWLVAVSWVRSELAQLRFNNGRTQGPKNSVQAS